MSYSAAIVGYVAGITTVFGGFDVSFVGFSWLWVLGLFLMMVSGVLAARADRDQANANT